LRRAEACAPTSSARTSEGRSAFRSIARAFGSRAAPLPSGAAPPCAAPPGPSFASPRVTDQPERTFGCERMPPEVGNVIVPDVETTSRRFGEARLYDCLLSDDW